MGRMQKRRMFRVSLEAGKAPAPVVPPAVAEQPRDVCVPAQRQRRPVLWCRYYVSAWSRNQTPGGFMIDMSVHHMAALRMVAEAAGAGMPTSVKAQTHNTQSGLAPPDGAEATVTWESGLVSSVALCMVAPSVRPPPPLQAHHPACLSCAPYCRTV